MSAGHGSAVVADVVAAGAAFVSALGVIHEFQFHEVVGTISGLCAITYYAYLFVRWVARCGNKKQK